MLAVPEISRITTLPMSRRSPREKELGRRSRKRLIQHLQARDGLLRNRSASAVAICVSASSNIVHHFFAISLIRMPWLRPLAVATQISSP
jgi:hypothetical protein